MDRIAVLLDTDIGSDIDDAVALAYLLKQPRCELLGITTVSGEPALRASLADAVCQAAGRPEMPIHVGTEAPLLIPPRQPRAPHAEALSAAWPHRTFSRENTAVEFLRRTIRSRPGEITLLTIGPLTNAALLYALDPEIPGLLKQHVMMGGRYFTPADEGQSPEWNIICDPHAAAKVFMTPLPRLVGIGLDVTMECQLEADECRRRFTAAGGPLAPVAAMAEVWFRHANQITFHDPLAAAFIFDEALCTLQRGQIEIDLDNVSSRGHTRPVTGSDLTSHAMAQSVDAGAFFRDYFEVVNG